MTQSREAHNASVKKYNAANRDKIAKRRHLYSLLHGAELAAKERARYAADPDKARERNRRYRVKHRTSQTHQRRHRYLRRRAALAAKYRDEIAAVLLKGGKNEQRQRTPRTL
jgi:hypothetical protein